LHREAIYRDAAITAIYAAVGEAHVSIDKTDYPADPPCYILQKLGGKETPG